MNIDRMHLEFDQRANKLASNHYQVLLPSQKDAKLNEAQVFAVEHIFAIRDLYEKDQQSKDLLAPLTVKFPDQPVIIPTEITANREYRINTDTLKYKYAHFRKAVALCTDGTTVPVSLKDHDEIDMLKRNPLQKPNVNWGRVLATLGKTPDISGISIYLHTDYAPAGIRVEYIKRPAEVFFGNYDSIEYLRCLERGGTGCNEYYKATDPPVDCEFHPHYHDLIVDIAVYLHTGKTENPNLLAIFKDKLNQVI